MRLLDETGQVAVEIQGLRFEYLGKTHARDADRESRRLALRVPVAAQGASRKDKSLELPRQPARASWLIFADSGGVGDALSALLEAQGERSILVSRGEAYEQTDSEHFRIHPERPEDIRRLFEAALRIRSAELSWHCPSLES